MVRESEAGVFHSHECNVIDERKGRSEPFAGLCEALNCQPMQNHPYLPATLLIRTDIPPASRY